MKNSALASLVALFCGLALARTQGATFTATNTTDSGSGSLRQAILDANAATGDDVIAFTVTGTITLDSALPTVTDNTTILGPGTNLLTVSGNNSVPIFAVASGTNLTTISGLTLANGVARNNLNGAAILNLGRLTILNCAFVNNQNIGGWGGGGWGGAIFNSGELSLFDTTFSGNQAAGQNGDNPSGGGGGGMGGGLFTQSGIVQISGCSFISNTATGGNGGSQVNGGNAGKGGGLNGGQFGTFLHWDGYPGGFGGGGGGGDRSQGNGGSGGFAGGGGAGSCGIGGPGGVGGGAGGGRINNFGCYYGGGGGGTGLGGGIFVFSGIVTIVNCSFVGNKVAGGLGGYGAQTGQGNNGNGIGPDFFNMSGNIQPLLTATTLGGGTVEVDPPYPPYLSNSWALVTATPSPGWKFLHWLGDASGTDNPVSVTMTVSKSVQAVFVPLDYAVTALASAGGSVSLSPSDGHYFINSVVSVSATSSNGWGFMYWQGDASGTNNPVMLTVDAPKNVTAVFGANLTTAVIGAGSIQLSQSNPLTNGSLVSVTATPNASWIFDHWSGDASGTDNPVSVTMTGPKSVQAVFAPVVYAVTALASAGGSVSLSPSDGPYLSNSVVSVSATSSNGWGFMYWQGDASGTNNPVMLTVDAPKNVTAVFGANLTTAVIGAGSIQLSESNPLTNGRLVSVTATPTVGWAFSHWLGDASGPDNPVSVTMTGPKSVQAVFVPLCTVSATTAGGGSVSLSPNAGSYPSNSVVSVSATSSNGWTFMYWKGDASGTDNPLNLAVNGNKNVTAVFGTIPTTGVIGNGLIELNATNLVPFGSVVRATAVPNSGSYFVQWGGALSGTKSPSEFVLVSTNAVRAVFGTLPLGQVALTARITGAGKVTFTPNQQFYSLGDSVIVSASPLDAFYDFFAGWSGDVTSLTNPFVLTLDGSKIVTANFSPYNDALQITKQGSTVQMNWRYRTLYQQLPLGLQGWLIASLESSTNLLANPTWTPIDLNTQTQTGDTYSVTVPATNSQHFFRLRESAMVPIFQYAIFYNGQLEFTQCPPLTIRGRTHANGPICLGAAPGNTLQFMKTVTTTSLIINSNLGGYTSFAAPVYSDSPPFITGVPTLNLPIGTNNTPAAVREIVNMPPFGESASSLMGQQRYCNKAAVVILVSNLTVTLMVKYKDSLTGTSTNYPYNSGSPSTANNAMLAQVLPFLKLTNSFTDYRENSKTVIPTQIDIGVLKNWLPTNSIVTNRYVPGSGTQPNIFYVADFRTNTASQLRAVRLMNGSIIPTNAAPSGAATGLTIATPNPLYVKGNYNLPNAGHAGATNTSATFPASLVCDAITILSGNWNDASASLGSRNATSTTINAAIIAGSVYSTGSASGQWSGGVHNLTRLLESWSGRVLTLNSSLVNLYNSVQADRQFQNPGVYYNAPTRNFNFDFNFLMASKLPPGCPVWVGSTSTE